MSAHANRGPAASFRTVLLGAGLATLAVAGCAEKQVVAGPGATVYALDLDGGAKKCGVPADPALGEKKEMALAITVGNDGGWCGVTVAMPGPKPYRAGLVVARAAHGHVFVHTVGDRTRIDYTPDRAYAGNDSFAVKLIPGDQIVRATVSVDPG